MSDELYENTYNKGNHFSFGKNWKDFLATLTQERIEEAKKSLVNFLGGKDKILGKTFVDIGCGSGLFSLAAYLLGASRIVSIDVDDFSIACVKYLKDKNNNPSNWETIKGSALNENFIKSLGRFDIVYSWGVLHHSGNMYKAFDNIIHLIKPGGLFYLAIYNDNTDKLIEGTSILWLKIKKLYNRSGYLAKKIMLIFYVFLFFIGLLISGKNPFKYIKNYKSNRGMNWINDLIDWIGGYPYEFASTKTVISHFENFGLKCSRVVGARSIGCNEFLFLTPANFNKQEKTENEKVAVIIPVYNSSKTIDKCIESIFNQTYKNLVVICINDASTDNSFEKLLFWQKKYGSEKFTIISNEKNLGVTKTLNRGLNLVNTRYTARLDADDWWEKSKIEKQIKFLKKNPEYKIIGSDYINYNGKIEKRVYTREDNDMIRMNIIRCNPFAHSCVIYDTELVKKVGGYDESIKYGGDYDLYLRMFPFTKFHNLKEFLCFRAIENEGISIKKQREQMLQGVKTQIKYIHKYGLSKKNYIYTFKLLGIAFTPKFIRNLKRFILG